ncbi:excalibur calcium-binding domain-containing protein [Rhizobium sp. TH2]|uniref:excalibur calcium-binding domain-containing protein n=1 Tax=Rhizobium sp. TH2 TaxID=2775403 RepID=UPI0021579132|nr:excalibur calcium-binding domain-containing protein [Rhizobium sp. TH2]UVC07230.1 excalibur calcium-binding domain-containing protein [Rhizobium sp. TH2]
MNIGKVIGTVAFSTIIAISAFDGACADKRYCKQMESCAEAVESWCNGHFDRDRDGDGIPCENICLSREQTLAEEVKIGCSL